MRSLQRNREEVTVTRRWGAYILGLALVLSSAIGIGFPARVLADTTYTTCPTFSQFRNDVQAVSGTGTITFGTGAANCVLHATSTTMTQINSMVTINGNGLTLSGGTVASRGNFALLTGGVIGELVVDQTTLEYAVAGIITPPASW